VAQHDLATEPPGGDLQPGHGIDGGDVRVTDRGHIADDKRGTVPLCQRAQPIA
jgi:hypothetical protein